jgi:hypothetical protein
MASDSRNGRGVPYPNHKWPGSNARWATMLSADASEVLRSTVATGDDLTEKWLLGHGTQDVTRGVAATQAAFMISPRVEAGAPSTVMVDVINARGAHAFPVGSPDLVENWVYLKVQGPAGTIYTSGDLDAGERLPAEAHRFGVTLLGADARPLQHHDLTTISAVGEKRFLMPGVVRSETYSLPAEKLAYPMDISAELRYRRARREFLDELFGPQMPSFPVVTLAMARCRLDARDAPLRCVFSADEGKGAGSDHSL